MDEEWSVMRAHLLRRRITVLVHSHEIPRLYNSSLQLVCTRVTRTSQNVDKS